MARIDPSRQVSMVGSSKKIGDGPKGPIYLKRSKTLKNGIFHTHPCGFYIKNRPFAIEMAS